MNLRKAAHQALEALEYLDGYNGWVEVGKEIADLQIALADTQDWDEIEALRASLREHMAEIHRLRAAGRQALEALETSLYPQAKQQKASTTLRAALAKDAAETNFGNMAQAVDCYGDGNVYRGQRSRDSKTQTITFSKVETVEPVAYVTGYRDGFCVINPVEHVVFPTGMALYLSPPKREPLTDEEIEAVADSLPVDDLSMPTTWHLRLARAVERAHNIGGEE